MLIHTPQWHLLGNQRLISLGWGAWKIRSHERKLPGGQLPQVGRGRLKWMTFTSVLPCLLFFQTSPVTVLTLPQISAPDILKHYLSLGLDFFSYKMRVKNSYFTLLYENELSKFNSQTAVCCLILIWVDHIWTFSGLLILIRVSK